MTRVLGVTATPNRTDGVGLGKVFQSVAYTYELRRAIREQYLVPIRAKRIRVKSVDLDNVKTHHGDFDQAELGAIMAQEKALHGQVAPLLELAGDRRTLAFGVDVAHAHALAEMINRYKPDSAIAVDGSASVAERAAALSLFRAGRFQFLTNCLDLDTEILTVDGWRRHDGIREGTSLATMNRTTGACEWQPAQRVIRRAREPGERMVRLSNQTLDVRVTEGHRMVVGKGTEKRWEIAQAETLPDRGGCYRLPVATFGAPSRTVNLTLDECEFIGLWITDGHLDRSGGHRGITIVQSTRFADSIAAVERVLTACKFDWKLTTRIAPLSTHLQHLYRIPRGSIGGQLKRRGFDRLDQYLDKSLAPALLDLDREQARALFKGLWLGDGTKERGRRHRGGVRRGWGIVNTDRTLLDRVQALAVTRGFGANISPPRDNGPLATKPIYTLRIRDRAYVDTNNHTIPTSGGNPATFESEHRDEQVWCVTTENGTIVTRRNGKALVMGQCALYTEGFNEPSISCLALCRPTQSLVLHTQMLGRVTRLLGRTMQESIANGKLNGLALDFVGNSRHRLINAADALAGAVLDDVMAALVEKKLEGDGSLDLEQILDAVAEEAAVESADRRDKANLIAIATYRSKEIDPFVGDIVPPLDPNSPAAKRPATENQLAALDKAGLGIPPPGFSFGEASRLLDGVAERRRLGLATIPQARLLAARKVDTKGMTFARATQLILMLKAGGWKPYALLGQPEYGRKRS